MGRAAASLKRVCNADLTYTDARNWPSWRNKATSRFHLTPGQVHQVFFLVRNRIQVVENRQGCAGSNKHFPVEANRVRKEHLLQALLLGERRVDPQVRRAR
jgi:hypothetical protein